MPRASGFVLLAVLVLFIVAFRTSSSQRADRLVRGEQQAWATLASLHAAARTELQRGSPVAQLTLGALLASVPGPTILRDAGDGRAEYAADESYMYGFALVPIRHDDGSSTTGYVARAWPLVFGVTGDTEWYLTQSGQLWEGQNPLGRSGLQRAFPPPFPEPSLSDTTALWWRQDTTIAR